MCLFPLQPRQQLYYQTWGNVCQFEMVSLWSFNLNWTSWVKLQVFSYVFHLYFPLCKFFLHDLCSDRLLDFSQCLLFFLMVFKAITYFFLATMGLHCSASSFSSCNEWQLFIFVVLGFSGRFLCSVPPAKSFSISETHETLSGWTPCDLGCKHSLSLSFGFPTYVAFVSISISLFFFGSWILNPD